MVENESVWLTQLQMAELFQATKQNVSLHINNIFKEGELTKESVVKQSLTTAADGKRYKTNFYNLDVIISVGYRIKSIRGTQFRQWANKILKEYMLRGYSINQRLLSIEERMDRKFLECNKRLDDLTGKVEFFVRTSMTPVEGVFFNGQIFDAYLFVSNLIKSANYRIVLIDNYVDASVLTLLDKRKRNVVATIYTQTISSHLKLDIERHNMQYPQIDVNRVRDIHDRFLVIDDTLFHIGASIKDLGKKLFAFSKMEIKPEFILDSVVQK